MSVLPTLLAAPEIFASEGGIPRILQLYLRALADTRGADAVRLVALNDAELSAARLAAHGAAGVRRARGCGRSRGRFIGAVLRHARGCGAIVCGHVAQAPVAWLAARLYPGLRYAIVAHGIEAWRPFTPAERLALRGARRVLCVSDFTRRELLRHCALPAERAIVVPNGLAPNFPVAPGAALASCPPVILSVTRLTHTDRYKGIDRLIAALPEIRRAVPGAVLRVIGRGDDRPRLEELRDRLGLADAVQFAGRVADDELAAELRRCRLFALPSTGEGFGLAFLEAMAAGRPCLGVAAGGVPEVVAPEAGVLAATPEPAALAAAALAALQHPWDQSAILERARAFAYPVFRARISGVLESITARADPAAAPAPGPNASRSA